MSNQVHTFNLQFLRTIQERLGFNSRHCTKHREDKAHSLTLWSISHELFPKHLCKLDNLLREYKGSSSTWKTFNCQKHSEDVLSWDFTSRKTYQQYWKLKISTVFPQKWHHQQAISHLTGKGWSKRPKNKLVTKFWVVPLFFLSIYYIYGRVTTAVVMNRSKQ